MKTANIFLPVLLILCLACALVFAIRRPCECEDPVPIPESAIWYLQSQNDSLTASNEALDRRVSEYQLQADSLRRKISGTMQTIDKLKKQQHEKIIRMDSLYSLELFDYFSEFKP